jgi:hypothetical protein
MSNIFDSVMTLCVCGTRFWPRDKHDTKCYGCQAGEHMAAMEPQPQIAADKRDKQEEEVDAAQE